MDNDVANSSSGMVIERKRRSFLVNFVIRLVKEKPLGTVGAVITLLLLLTGTFADLLAPYGMNETHMTDILLAPSTQYWLGTDNLGRDMLSRIIFGARISVIVGLAASTCGTLFAVIVGMLSGYIGGKLDLIVQRFVDMFMCFPSIILIMVIMAIIEPGVVQIIIVLGLLYGMTTSRIVRGAVIGLKMNTYVTAAEAIGCSNTRILTGHILPNIMPAVIIIFTTQVPAVILTEASLSFLGFGIPPPAPSWGGMLSRGGLMNIFRAPWMAIWPGLALSIVVYGINMFGDAMRDLLDPRLRGGVGRYGMRVKKRPSKK